MLPHLQKLYRWSFGTVLLEIHRYEKSKLATLNYWTSANNILPRKGPWNKTWDVFQYNVIVILVIPITGWSFFILKQGHGIFEHDDVIKWQYFPRYWPFVQGIHRSLVNIPNKSQWRGALMFSLICTWINGWVNNRKAGDLRLHCAHYDITVMT